MVADVHRTLFGGGVFYYPADTKDPTKPQGKLRLLYEAMPMAYVIEQAGATDPPGGDRFSTYPKSLHERTPVFVARGSGQKAEEFIAQYDR
jgi:fructose-1,6-bisphosphatase I